MNTLLKNFKTISINNNIDNLCDILENSSVEYDEYQELEEDNYDDINVTIERYQRYIRYMNIWEVNGVCYLYIYHLISEFINRNVKCDPLSYKIDNELIKMISKHS